MVYETTFVDIGKVSVLECVQAETKNRPCLLKAIGERGAVRFVALVAFSKMYPEDCDRHGAILFDLGVSAFFCQMRTMRNAQDYFHKLKRGERIVVSEDAEALKQLRESGIGCFGAPPSCRRWLNAQGEPISEPADFLARHLAAACCTLSRDMYSGRETVDDGMVRLLEIGKATVGEVSGADFDFMLKWHDKLEAVARTINHHIDIGDCTPNMDKVDAFLVFYSNGQKTIDRLSGIDLFAQHLLERSGEVCASRGKNWGIRIAEVEPFSSLRFPGARHL